MTGRARDPGGAPIDLLWITHPHSDHIGGAVDVLHHVGDLARRRRRPGDHWPTARFNESERLDPRAAAQLRRYVRPCTVSSTLRSPPGLPGAEYDDCLLLERVTNADHGRHTVKDRKEIGTLCGNKPASQ